MAASLLRFGFTRGQEENEPKSTENESKKRKETSDDTSKDTSNETNNETNNVPKIITTEKSTRKFMSDWTVGRPWLRFENEEQLMYCDVCQKFDTTRGRIKNAFICGTNNFRSSAVKDHQKSQAHLRALDRKLATERPSCTPLMKGKLLSK